MTTWHELLTDKFFKLAEASLANTGEPPGSPEVIQYPDGTIKIANFEEQETSLQLAVRDAFLDVTKAKTAYPFGALFLKIRWKGNLVLGDSIRLLDGSGIFVYAELLELQHPGNYIESILLIDREQWESQRLAFPATAPIGTLEFITSDPGGLLFESIAVSEDYIDFVSLPPGKPDAWETPEPLLGSVIQQPSFFNRGSSVSIIFDAETGLPAAPITCALLSIVDVALRPYITNWSFVWTPLQEWVLSAPAQHDLLQDFNNQDSGFVTLPEGAHVWYGSGQLFIGYARPGAHPQGFVWGQYKDPQGQERFLFPGNPVSRTALGQKSNVVDAPAMPGEIDLIFLYAGVESPYSESPLFSLGELTTAFLNTALRPDKHGLFVGLRFDPTGEYSYVFPDMLQTASGETYDVLSLFWDSENILIDDGKVTSNAQEGADVQQSHKPTISVRTEVFAPEELPKTVIISYLKITGKLMLETITISYPDSPVISVRHRILNISGDVIEGIRLVRELFPTIDNGNILPSETISMTTGWGAGLIPKEDLVYATGPQSGHVLGMFSTNRFRHNTGHTENPLAWRSTGEQSIIFSGTGALSFDGAGAPATSLTEDPAGALAGRYQNADQKSDGLFGMVFSLEKPLAADHYIDFHYYLIAAESKDSLLSLVSRIGRLGTLPGPLSKLEVTATVEHPALGISSRELEIVSILDGSDTEAFRRKLRAQSSTIIDGSELGPEVLVENLDPFTGATTTFLRADPDV